MLYIKADLVCDLCSTVVEVRGATYSIDPETPTGDDWLLPAGWWHKPRHRTVAYAPNDICLSCRKQLIQAQLVELDRLAERGIWYRGQQQHEEEVSHLQTDLVLLDDPHRRREVIPDRGRDIWLVNKNGDQR